MEIKGIFFDLYGTLLICDDLSRAWEKWQNTFIHTLNAHGASLNRKRFGAITSEFFSKSMLGRENSLTPYESRIKEFSPQFGVDLSDAELGNIAQATVAAWNENISLDPEAVPVLQEIRQTRKTALISNFDYPPYINRLLPQHGLDKLFDHITVSGAIGVEKPDPAVFLPALETTGLEPSETIYVGDSNVDVVGARDAGITPIRIARDKTIGDIPEAYEISRLSQILEYLTVLNDAEIADQTLFSRRLTYSQAK